MLDASTFAGYGISRVMMWIAAAIMLLVVGSVVIQAIVRGIRDLRAPRVTVPASVARMRRTASMHGSRGDDWFYVTFRMEDGSLEEFSVTENDYLVLAEGEKGELTRQGSRFIAFAHEQ